MNHPKALLLLFVIFPYYLLSMMPKKQDLISSTTITVHLIDRLNKILNEYGYPQTQRTFILEMQLQDTITFRVNWPEYTKRFQLSGNMLYEKLDENH